MTSNVDDATRNSIKIINRKWIWKRTIDTEEDIHAKEIMCLQKVDGYSFK